MSRDLHQASTHLESWCYGFRGSQPTFHWQTTCPLHIRPPPTILPKNFRWQGRGICKRHLHLRAKMEWFLLVVRTALLNKILQKYVRSPGSRERWPHSKEMVSPGITLMVSFAGSSPKTLQRMSIELRSRTGELLLLFAPRPGGATKPGVLKIVNPVQIYISSDCETYLMPTPVPWSTPLT